MEILKFYADWCVQCQNLEKNLKNTGFEYKSIDVDLEENEPLLEKYNILSLPSIVVLKDGIMVNKLQGTMTTGELIEEFNKYK